MTAHDSAKQVLTKNRNECSRSPEIRIASPLLLAALVTFLFLASACSSDSTDNTNSKTVAYVMPTQPTPSRINPPLASSRPVATSTDSAPDLDETMRQDILAAADSKITYAQLTKNADRYQAQPWAFRGSIVQIQEADGQTSALVALDVFHNHIMKVTANFTTDFVEKDQVYVVGYLAGNYSYTSVAGWNMTLPKINATAILKPAEAARIKAGKTTSIKTKR